MADITKRIPIAIGIKPSQTVTFTNKTIDCGPGNGNVITNIPNSALENNSMEINGQTIELGGSVILTGSGVLTNYVSSLTNGTGISLDQATGDVEITVDATLDDIVTNGATTSQDITVGKIYFKNVFGTLTDLPSATTYHGMFAHVHNEARAYFAHAGAWIQLLDTNTVISELGGVNITTPSSGQVLKYDGTNWINDSDSSGGGSLDALSDVTLTSPSNGQVLKYNGTNWVNGTDEVGTGLASRATASAQSQSIAQNAYDSFQLTAAPSYSILSITVDKPSWVTLYVDTTARTNDINSGRLQSQDPGPNDGIIAEVVTTNTNETVRFTPSTIGWNTSGSVIQCKVVSNTTGTNQFNIDLSYVALEN